MTYTRPGPQADCGFLVDLGAGRASGGEAGFQECSIGGVAMTIAGWGGGELPATGEPSLRPPANGVIAVTLERGVVDSDQLSGWLGADRTEVRTVRVALRSADRLTTVATWVFDGARISRFVSRPIAAGGSEVEVEELTLACGGVALEGDASVPAPGRVDVEQAVDADPEEHE